MLLWILSCVVTDACFMKEIAAMFPLIFKMVIDDTDWLHTYMHILQYYHVSKLSITVVNFTLENRLTHSDLNDVHFQGFYMSIIGKFCWIYCLAVGTKEPRREG